MRSRSGYETLPIPRGERLKGKSNFRFAQLVTHGLSAFSVHADLICARLAAFFAVLTLIGLLVAAGVAADAWFSCAQGAAAWSAVGAIGVLLLPIPLSGLALIACLILLSLRSHSVSVPLNETNVYLPGRD
jgi:hypothetical protein